MKNNSFKYGDNTPQRLAQQITFETEDKHRQCQLVLFLVVLHEIKKQIFKF